MRNSTTQTGRARDGFRLMLMKRRSFPLWLLRDVPALLGAMLSFWTLIIFAMTSAWKTAAQSIRDRIALLLALALAEASLDYALWRKAYRRISWHPRGVTLQVFPPSTDWAYTQKRLRDFAHAFRNMNQIVDAYVDHIRNRFGISQRELVAHGSTDARLRRAAHHDLVTASPFAFILSRARSARPSKDERGSEVRAYSHPETPPTHRRDLLQRRGMQANLLIGEILTFKYQMNPVRNVEA